MKTRRFSFANGLLLLLFAALLAACTEYEDDYISKYCPGSCTEVSGRITTGDGSTPLKGANLLVQWENGNVMSGTSIVRKKAYAQTDADGRYTLRFLLRDEELESGYLSIETALPSENYFVCLPDDTLWPDEIRRDTTFTRNFHYPQRAKLVLELTNRQAMNLGDEIRTSIDFETPDGEPVRCSSRQHWSAQGNSRQTVAAPADHLAYLTISKTKSGLITTQTDTIYLTAEEQRVYKLTF